MKKKKTATPQTSSSDTETNKLGCNLCVSRGWRGPKCKDCELYQLEHYTEGVGYDENDTDFFCIAESPFAPGPSGSLTVHNGWSLDIEKLARKAFNQKREDTRYLMDLHGRYTYAIRCSRDKPKKKWIDCCASLLHEELESCFRLDDKKPIPIFAMGKGILQSLGVKVKKYQDIQGKFIEAETQNGRNVVIYSSLSKRQLAVKSGFFGVFKQHIDTFLSAVYDLKTHNIPIQTVTPIEKLTEHYVFPKSVQEVSDLVDEIIAYAPEGKDPASHPISIDTETNTKFPHRSKLKILSLVCSWEKAVATSIPLEHPQSPWTLEDVRPHLQRLLLCPKPKIFHNAKFDLNVLRSKGFEVRRTAWDTMLGEHLLNEDKRGFYSLKSIVRPALPAYAGYEDHLHDHLNKFEAETQLAEITKEQATPKKKKKAIKLKGAAKKLAEDDGFIHVPLTELNIYGAIDADVTWQLAGIQNKRMSQENNRVYKKRKRLATCGPHFKKLARPGRNVHNPTKALMYERAIPYTRALAKMELTGIRVDHDYIDDLVIEMDRSLNLSHVELNTMIPEEFHKAIGEFNPNSTAHLRTLLFGMGYRNPDTGEIVNYQGVVEPTRTDTGLESTNARFLRTLVTHHECKFSRLILKHRATHKARNTFVANIRALSMDDGRMHTSFHINGTATGRLSSSDENMQNVPARIGNHNIKKIFIPTDPENEVIINADAKAAEVRIYAAYSGDPNLIQALNDGMDPHSFFASKVYQPSVILDGVARGDRQGVLNMVGIDENHGWTYEDFQSRDYLSDTEPKYGKQLDKLRKIIKRVVFGTLYGAHPRKIADIVGIPKEQAAGIIRSLFKMFPTIDTYISQTKEQVQLLGMVETFIGRRRRFDLQGMTKFMASKAERQAVNFKIQSTSSEIVLGVLCEIMEPLEQDFGGRMLITVHDSVVFDLNKKYISQMPDFINEYGVKRVAEQYPWLPIPFQWDVEVGPSYGELSPVDKYLNQHTDTPQSSIDEEDFLEQEIRQDLEEISA